MIVAGSVLAMLLMGLAFDGFVNPAEDEDDATADDEGDGDMQDQSGIASSALSDLLLAAEAGGDPEDDDDLAVSSASLGTPMQFNYTPLDQVEPDEEASEDGSDALIYEPTSDTPMADDPAEARADSDWATVATDPAEGDFLEVEDLTDLEDGSEVSLVSNFNADTDALVLEFDGTADEAPEIEIDYDSEDGATVVLANGLPVTLVEGGHDMTLDNIRVVMRDEGDVDDPQVQPGTDEPVSVLHDVVNDVVDGGPQIPLDASVDLEVETDVPAPGLSLDDNLPLDLDPQLDEAVETVLDPVETVVDEVSDGLPLADELTQIMDDITTNMSDMGSAADMLDARGDIDAAFGTGGNDAQTGTFNNDLVIGGSGQDALFGDEGDDTLDAGAGNDELHGDFGNDLLQGGSGIDFLDGGEGDDMLDGGADRDLLFGGDGDDVIYGGAAADFLHGGMGSDTMNGGSGDDVLNGTFTNNPNGTFTSGSTDQDGGDVLWGGDGNDTLIIGQNDMAHGGTGADLFSTGDYIEDADVAGHVADFDPSEDRIEVIFDPDVNPNPQVAVQDFADGSGADILLNGNVILSVSGAQGMDPNLIDLRAMA